MRLERSITELRFTDGVFTFTLRCIPTATDKYGMFSKFPISNGLERVAF